MTRGDWGGKIPPTQLWKIAAGGPSGEKKKRGRKGKREREKEKKRERKEKEKKEEKRRKGREKSKLKVFLNYSFWLGVEARYIYFGWGCRLGKIHSGWGSRLDFSLWLGVLICKNVDSGWGP